MDLLLLCLFGAILQVNGWSDTKKRSFPPRFLFGVATAAYQVEGAWDEDGKSESIWDRFLHSHPEVTADGMNGDIASNSYHNLGRDVEMLRELGVDFYRFSIAWTRVLPSGFPNKINEQALQYYDELIDELIKYDIQPMVTMYHFDLPQSLQDLGGWANPLSVTWFEDYARVLFDRYGDKVPYWITINQPNSICIEGYGDSLMAPAISAKGTGDYLCVKNILLAHATAYRLYEREYKKKYKGSVGISMAVNWIDPLDLKSDADKLAAEKARAFTIGLYLDPIWGESGGFPSAVLDAVAEKTRGDRARLSALNAEEIRLLKGSADFLGMNHYTTYLARHTSSPREVPSFADDLGVDLTQSQQWTPAASPWLKSAPFGIYKALIHLNLQYSYPPIFITEHGWSTNIGLQDKSRATVIRSYLGAVLLAMEDGADVRGYTHWSLMDNVEWTAGISERFGLYQVDFGHENRTRTARLSALVYKHIISTRLVDDEWMPTDLNIRITPKKRVKTEL